MNMNNLRYKQMAKSPIVPQKNSGKKGRKVLKQSFTINRRENAETVGKEIKELLKMFPGSSEFLGRLGYTVRKKKFPLIKRKYPDISELRDQVTKFSTREIIEDPRPQIRKLLKSYPAFPDLRALNAIQLMADISQSGIDAKKLHVIQNALREITRAVYNGGLSLYNINWLISIYVRYIDALRAKYLQAYNNYRNHSKTEIRKLTNQLYKRQLQLMVMSKMKSKLSSLEHLNVKLKDTLYLHACISGDEIRKACQALKSGDGSKKIGESGKTANNIIYLILTLNMIFARIPILKPLVEDLQALIPDDSRDVILQKAMISNMLKLTDFQMNLAAGNKDKTRQVAATMFDYQQELINLYLNNGILTKQYEIDPYIKTAWIAKESKGLFEDDIYTKMLEHAFRTIGVLFNERVHVQGADTIAATMQDEIQYLLIEAGMLNS